MSDERPRPSQEIEGMRGPLSELPWSADFVMQAIEILPVLLRDGAILYQKPDHADSFIVGWPARARPEEIAADAIRRLGLDPIVLHSTSWRHHEDEVVLTYVTVVAPGSFVPESWTAIPVARAELARGDEMGPPPSIGVLQVLEHGLRHLSWLTRDDPVIARALPDWRDVLSGYVPEPFRAFGGPA